MLKYTIIKELALKFNANSMPTDAVIFALQLNIELKTEEDYIKEWGEYDNPLEFYPAILSTTKKGFTIFYKKNEEYKNFYILHECSHYIYKHHKDGHIEENDSNLLACFLIAPVKDLILNNIYSTINISLKYKIPFEKAEMYYKLLCENDIEYINAKKAYKNKIKKIEKLNTIKKIKTYCYCTFKENFLTIILLFLSVTTTIIVTSNKNTTSTLTTVPETTTTTYTLPETTTELTTEATTSQQTAISQTTTSQQPTPQSNKTVIVTKSGEKYHLPTCYHIANKSTLIEMDIKKAEDLGYKPCATCNP